MLDFLQTNYACLIVCLLFFGFALTDRSFDTRTTYRFLAAMAVVLLLTIVDGLEMVEAARSYPTVARSIYSAIGYALRPAVAILIVLIMHRNTKGRPRTLFILLQSSLFVINALLAFLSIFNQCMFGYTADNHFFRGPFGILPFITGVVYVLAMVVETLIGMKVREKGETTVIVLIGVLCLLGTGMESVFMLGGTLNVSCGLGIFYYYLYLHVNIYSRDLLTNAYNRRIFYLDIDKLNHDEAMLVGIDLNNLKQINDEGGHAAGDAALIMLTDTIRRNMGKGCSLYRMGGDEFTILCRHTEQARAEEMMQKIAQELAPTGYSFAYGCAHYQKGGSIDAATNAADRGMYAMKAAMKSVK